MNREAKEEDHPNSCSVIRMVNCVLIGDYAQYHPPPHCHPDCLQKSMKKIELYDIYLFIDGGQRFKAILSKIVEIIPQVTQDSNNLFLILPYYTVYIVCIIQ